MAVQFTPLPLDVFPDEAKPYIAQLNGQLRDLFALEGVLRNPIQGKRSDASIVRRADPQVDVSRITPAVSSGGTSSVTVGTPALTLGTANAVGSTTTVVSVNSSIAMFGTAATKGVSTGSAVGTSAYAARQDHVHALDFGSFAFDTSTPAGLSTAASAGSSASASRSDHAHKFPDRIQSTASNATLILSDNAADMTLTGSLGSVILVPASGPLKVSPVVPDVTGIIIPTIDADAGARIGLNAQFAAITQGNTSTEFDTWSSRFPGSCGQINTVTWVGYKGSAVGLTPASGSSGGNKVYQMNLPNVQISNGNANWDEAFGAFIGSPKRSLTAVTCSFAAGIKTDCATISGSSQFGIWIAQQTAQQTATNRIGLKIDAQNSGTNRYSIWTDTDLCKFGGPVDVDGAFGVTGIATFGVTITANGNLDHNGTNVGLYGATPTIQFGTTGTVTGHATGIGTAVTDLDTFTGNTGSTAYTLGDIILALKKIGALAY